MFDTEMPRPTRRRLLTVGTAIVAGSTLGVSGAAAATGDDSGRSTDWTARTSANGWPVLDTAPLHRVEGAGKLGIRLAEGDAATVLLYVVRRYCYEIEMLDSLDLTGHASEKRIQADMESNYLSGTALTIKEVYYPLGAPAGNGMSNAQIAIVEDILADCQGVVAWGGEMSPLKQSHFQIEVPPHDSRLLKLVAEINGWNEQPGKGAGAIDAFQPARISRARRARSAR